MAVSNINCPHCGIALEVENEWQGMELTCPQCQRDFVCQIPQQNGAVYPQAIIQQQNFQQPNFQQQQYMQQNFQQQNFQQQQNVVTPAGGKWCKPSVTIGGIFVAILLLVMASSGGFCAYEEHEIMKKYERRFRSCSDYDMQKAGRSPDMLKKTASLTSSFVKGFFTFFCYSRSAKYKQEKYYWLHKENMQEYKTQKDYFELLKMHEFNRRYY